MSDESEVLDGVSGANEGGNQGGDNGGSGERPPPGNGAEPGKPAPSAAPAVNFGENWRDGWVEQLPSDQREQARNYLKTRTSPHEVLRAGINADAKISQIMAERVKIPTGKDDDPKDVEAYRKARGVPEAPDKYDFKVPQEYGELSELDQQLKSDFLKRAHENNWSQKDVDIAVETHMAILKEAEAEKMKMAVQASQAARDELMTEWGRDFHANVELTNRMIESELMEIGITDPNERKAIMSQRFMDGTAFGENVPIVKMLAKIARERADDGAFVVGETGDGVDLDTKIDKIIALRSEDPKEYERMQPELQRLVAAQNRLKARGKG